MPTTEPPRDIEKEKSLLASVVKNMNDLLCKAGHPSKIHSVYEENLGELEASISGNVIFDWFRSGACAGKTCVYYDTDVKVSGIDAVSSALGSIDLVLVRVENSNLSADGMRHTWTLTGAVFKAVKKKELDSRTVYLAMQGLYPDLPPFNQLTQDQLVTMRNHIDMLADHLRK